VHNARSRLLDPNFAYRPALQYDYYPDPAQPTITFPVFDLYRWEVVQRELDNYHGLVRVKQSVPEAQGYLVPSGEARLREVLDRHGIRYRVLEQDTTMNVEVWHIRHVTRMDEEGLTLPYVDADLREHVREIDRRTLFIPTLQPARLLLPLMLEPQSSRGLVTEPGAHQFHFGAWLEEGEDYPILRVRQ
jgi:hypothetical protein